MRKRNLSKGLTLKRMTLAKLDNFIISQVRGGFDFAQADEGGIGVPRTMGGVECPSIDRCGGTVDPT